MSDIEQKRIFSENLNRYLSISEKSQKEIADSIGVSPQTFNTWCQGIAMPRIGKLQKLADYFHINKSDLLEDKSDSEYYTNPDTAKLAQEMFEDHDMRSLFHMKKNMDPDAFQTHIDYMKKLYKLEHPDYDEGC